MKIFYNGLVAIIYEHFSAELSNTITMKISCGSNILWPLETLIWCYSVTFGWLRRPKKSFFFCWSQSVSLNWKVCGTKWDFKKEPWLLKGTLISNLPIQLVNGYTSFFFFFFLYLFFLSFAFVLVLHFNALSEIRMPLPPSAPSSQEEKLEWIRTLGFSPYYSFEKVFLDIVCVLVWYY